MPDDDVALDDPEIWHEFWHSHNLNFDGEIIVNGDISIGLDSVSPLSIGLYAEDSHVNLPHIKTRGQLRKLLNALK